MLGVSSEGEEDYEESEDEDNGRGYVYVEGDSEEGEDEEGEEEEEEEEEAEEEEAEEEEQEEPKKKSQKSPKKEGNKAQNTRSKPGKRFQQSASPAAKKVGFHLESARTSALWMISHSSWAIVCAIVLILWYWKWKKIHFPTFESYTHTLFRVVLPRQNIVLFVPYTFGIPFFVPILRNILFSAMEKYQVVSPFFKYISLCPTHVVE